MTKLKNLYEAPISLIKGMAVTFKNLLSPSITLQYPTQKQPMTEEFRGLVDLRAEKCIVCLQCAKICPTGCLSITQKAGAEKKRELESFEYNIELCCFCGLCEQVCPSSAIYMSKIYEIATYGREELHINLLNPKKYARWLHPTVK